MNKGAKIAIATTVVFLAIACIVVIIIVTIHYSKMKQSSSLSSSSSNKVTSSNATSTSSASSETTSSSGSSSTSESSSSSSESSSSDASSSAPSGPNSFAYFLDDQEGPITGYQLDANTGEIVAAVATGYNGMTTPSCMLASPDGKFLFVNDWQNPNLVSLAIDPNTGDLSVLQTLNFPNGNLLNGFAHNQVRSTFYMCSFNSSEIYIVDYNMLTGIMTARAQSVSVDHPYWLAINNAGDTLYCGQKGNVTVFSISPSDGSITQQSSLSLGNTSTIGYLTVDNNDTFLYGSYASAAGYFQLKITGTTLTDMGADQWNVANLVPCVKVSPDGSQLYVLEHASGINYIFDIDPSTGVLTQSSMDNQNVDCWSITYFNSVAYFVPYGQSGSIPNMNLYVRDIVGGVITTIPAFTYNTIPNYALQVLIAVVE
jgi:6-phosphogluconolactonase (cycloisomerase 2 family)